MKPSGRVLEMEEDLCLNCWSKLKPCRFCSVRRSMEPKSDPCFDGLLWDGKFWKRRTGDLEDIPRVEVQR